MQQLVVGNIVEGKVTGITKFGAFVDLGCGDATAKAWGCDLTYDYVKINGDYRT